MTPELLERLIRMERVFMPHAQRQRREAYIRQTGDEPKPGAFLRFAHYTTATAAMNIISEKRLWMRNTNCMSDYSEVRHGLTMLEKFFAHDNSDMTNLVAALDACSPGAMQEAINIFKGWSQDSTLNTYVSSISEHNESEDLHGRLSMWRAFGGNAARVALVFKVPYMSDVTAALNVMFSPVAYLSEEGMCDVIREVTDNINRERDFLQATDRQSLVGASFAMLISAITCLKHEGFREEREWRVIYAPKRQSSPLMQSIIRDVSGVPQQIYLLPLDVRESEVVADIEFSKMFDRLIIGPSPYPWPMYEAFTDALSKAGVQDAGSRVFASNIPIRL